MLRIIEIREKRKKLRSEMICGIVKMNVKVASNGKFMRCGGCGEKRIELFKENEAQLRMVVHVHLKGDIEDVIVKHLTD